MPAQQHEHKRLERNGIYSLEPGRMEDVPTYGTESTAERKKREEALQEESRVAEAAWKARADRKDWDWDRVNSPKISGAKRSTRTKCLKA